MYTFIKAEAKKELIIIFYNQKCHQISLFSNDKLIVFDVYELQLQSTPDRMSICHYCIIVYAK